MDASKEVFVSNRLWQPRAKSACLFRFFSFPLPFFLFTLSRYFFFPYYPPSGPLPSLKKLAILSIHSTPSFLSLLISIKHIPHNYLSNQLPPPLFPLSTKHTLYKRNYHNMAGPTPKPLQKIESVHLKGKGGDIPLRPLPSMVMAQYRTNGNSHYTSH